MRFGTVFQDPVTIKQMHVIHNAPGSRGHCLAPTPIESRTIHTVSTYTKNKIICVHAYVYKKHYLLTLYKFTLPYMCLSLRKPVLSARKI